MVQPPAGVASSAFDAVSVQSMSSEPPLGHHPVIGRSAEPDGSGRGEPVGVRRARGQRRRPVEVGHRGPGGGAPVERHRGRGGAGILGAKAQVDAGQGVAARVGAGCESLNSVGSASQAPIKVQVLPDVAHQRRGRLGLDHDPIAEQEQRERAGQQQQRRRTAQAAAWNGRRFAGGAGPARPWHAVPAPGLGARICMDRSGWICELWPTAGGLVAPHVRCPCVGIVQGVPCPRGRRIVRQRPAVACALAIIGALFTTVLRSGFQRSGSPPAPPFHPRAQSGAPREAPA